MEGVPAKQCWTARKDSHGPDGTPHKLNWLHECQSACINDSRCEAIDWEPSNVGKTCWILTSTAIKQTTKTGVITNYQLDRTCLGESCFYDTPCAFRHCRVAYFSLHPNNLFLQYFYDNRRSLVVHCHTDVDSWSRVGFELDMPSTFRLCHVAYLTLIPATGGEVTHQCRSLPQIT